MKKAVLILIISLLLLSLVIAADINKSSNKTIITGKGEIVMTKIMTKECDTSGVCTINKEITITRTKDNVTRIISRNINVTINKTIEVDENNKTYLKINATARKEIKIMPDTASERAIEVLGGKYTTIELKDTGQYHINAVKTAKILGLFNKNYNESVEIDATTGETKVHKPWWKFMAVDE